LRPRLSTSLPLSCIGSLNQGHQNRAFRRHNRAAVRCQVFGSGTRPTTILSEAIDRKAMARNRRNGIVTSDKKAGANRCNARKSTGPRTPEGKSAVRLNALRYGLLSTEVLLPGEDGEALRGGLGEHLRAELQPAGELENLLVDRVVATLWRLRRLGRVEPASSPGNASRSWASARSETRRNTRRVTPNG